MKIKRREFIKLASAGIAMPWLSNIARAQQGGASPKRVLTVIDLYGRYGSHTSSSESAQAPWIASDNGDYPLTPEDLGWMLKPLENHIGNLSVLSNTVMRSRQVLGGGASHAQVNSYALTASRVSGNIRSSATVSANPSINTFIGDQLNEAAAIKSVFNSLGIGGGGIGEANYASDGRRASNLGNPAAVYNSAFGMGGGSDNQQLISQQLVVEQVRNQLINIAPELVQANASTVVDAYRSSIDQIASELEVRANATCSDRTPNNVRTSGAGAAGTGQMFDAAYDLFACGITPSVLLGWTETNRHGWLADTDLFDNSVNNFLTNRNYHNLSHQRNEAAGAAQGLVLRRQVSEIARVADRLAATPELDGSGDTMMDNTVIFMTQCMSANVHGTNTPYYRFFLAGKNTNINRGMHFDCSGHSDNEVFTTLAQGVNIPITQFGGYSGANFGNNGRTLNTGPISKALIQTLGA